MTIYGWDMSHYDWDRGLTAAEISGAKNAGISFITHKIGEGSSYTDPKFDDFWRAAKVARRAGVLVGAYYVNWPGEQVPQSTRFVRLLKELAPGWDDDAFILQVDSEKFGYMPRPPSAGEIRTFIATLRSQCPDYRPVLYGPKWVYGNELANVSAPLWASNYGSNPVANYRDAYPGDGSSRWGAYSGRVPRILQYGSKTIIGTQRVCDANAFRGTLAELKAMVYPKSANTPTQPDKENDMATPEEFVTELMRYQMGHPGQANLDFKTLLRNLHQQNKGPRFDDWDASVRSDDLRSAVTTVAVMVGEVAQAVAALSAKIDALGTPGDPA